MGSFELADQVGIDVGFHVLEYMHKVLGDAYRPCPLLAEKVEAGDLGKKTGAGFYDYEGGDGAQIPTDAVDADIRRRLLAVMANEVAGLIGGDVADADAIDQAVMLGAGFPDGPAKLADGEGLDALVDTLDALADETGEERYAATDHLREAADAGGFRGGADGAGGADGDDGADYDTLNVTVDERIGHIEIDRPHRMNTISGELLDDLAGAIDRLDADDDVRAILLSGAGDRAFSAGADVQSMAGGGGNPLEAVEISRTGQQTFGKLEASDKPVIAAIDGYCLGGGMELATAADLRVASERSELGQPEHNLGLLPGWGAPSGSPGSSARAAQRRSSSPPTATRRRRWRSTASSTRSFPATSSTSGHGSWPKTSPPGPPIAQRYTKRAMHAGRGDDEAGLEVEAQAFGHLMNTEDLMEGMTAFMGDGDPDFKGK